MDDSGPPEADPNIILRFLLEFTAKLLQIKSKSNLLDNLLNVVHIQLHVVFYISRLLGRWDVEPVGRQSSFIFIVPAPNYNGGMRLQALDLKGKNEEKRKNKKRKNTRGLGF